MVVELARFEEKEDVERVVDLVRAAPVVAVVPAADLVPVEALEFRGEDRVQIRVRVAANVRELRLQRDVDQVVQAREQARQLAHPRQENEAELLIAVLDHRVEAAQEVPVGARQFPVAERGPACRIRPPERPPADRCARAASGDGNGPRRDLVRGRPAAPSPPAGPPRFSERSPGSRNCPRRN